MRVLWSVRVALAAATVVSSVAGCTNTSTPPQRRSPVASQPPTANAVASTKSAGPTRPSSLTVFARLIDHHLPADDTGMHEAHGCDTSGPGRIVRITLLPDEPVPLCTIVRPDQQLEVVNRMVKVLHGRALRAEIGFGHQQRQGLAVGSSMLFRQPFKAYLAPGEHRFYYVSGRLSADIWLKHTAILSN
jgi:hypothetical protein